MCPFCLLSSLWLWLGAASGGGVIAFIVKKLRARRVRLTAGETSAIAGEENPT
ncbi:MAG: hypothetical protein ABW321_14900 [Polyangiales bacterium]